MSINYISFYLKYMAFFYIKPYFLFCKNIIIKNYYHNSFYGAINKLYLKSTTHYTVGIIFYIKNTGGMNMSSSGLFELNSENKELLCQVAKALSVPTRIDIIGLLYQNPLSVQEVAEQLHLPQSSAGVHIQILEDAGIIRSERIIRNGSVFKICYVEKFLVNIILRSSSPSISHISSLEIPIGSYTDCYAEMPCGLISEDSFIGTEDELRSFYLFDKINAQLIWMAKGFLEYKVPNILPKHKQCKQLSLSMELCSEAPGYNENYPSDIYLSINDRSCGHYHSAGDFGARRGIYTPQFWQSGLTQYGKLVTWQINQDGTFINGEYVSSLKIQELMVELKSYIKFRIECRESSKYCGGINLFGEKAGDYDQPIILTLEH